MGLDVLWDDQPDGARVEADAWFGDRDGILVDLIRNLVAASATPMTTSAVVESVGGLLSQYWVSWSRDAISTVVKAMVESDDVLGVDLLGRIYAPESVGRPHSEIGKYGRRAAQLAGELSEFEFDSSEDVARLNEKRLFQEELLGRDHERLLAFSVREGDKEARERMMLANTRLVASLSRRVATDEITLDHDDLFQTGCLGLLHAIDKFDPGKGFKLSTYATWWIKQAIYRSIADTGRTIRVPVHVHERIRRVERAEVKLWRDLGEEPPIADLVREAKITRQQLEEIRTIPEVVALDSVDLESFSDPTQATSEDLVLAQLAAANARRVIDALPYRERIVIERRLGLYGEPWTLEAIGHELGITRERVRQLEKAALNQLTLLLHLT